MRKILGFLAALAAVAATGLFVAPAQAAVPSGYADTQQVLIDPVTKVGGETVALQVRTVPDRTCNSWTVSIDYTTSDRTISGTIPQSTKTGGGQSAFTVEFDTPAVREVTTQTSTVVCNFTPAVAAPASSSTGTASVTQASVSSLATVSRSCGTGCVTNSSTVTLLPPAGANNNSGILPTTGTEIGLWLLVIGALLVIGGTGVAVVARRRNA